MLTALHAVLTELHAAQAPAATTQQEAAGDTARSSCSCSAMFSLTRSMLIDKLIREVQQLLLAVAPTDSQGQLMPPPDEAERVAGRERYVWKFSDEMYHRYWDKVRRRSVQCITCCVLFWQRSLILHDSSNDARVLNTSLQRSADCVSGCKCSPYSTLY